VSIDQLTNRVSIFNILEQIVVPSLPVLISEMVVFAVIRKDDELSEVDYKCRLKISMSDAPIGELDGLIRFASGPTARMLFNFSGLPIESKGDIQFEIELPGQQVHEVRVPVVKLAPAVEAVPTEDVRPVG
jgi:hypothetical protein